MLMSVFYIKDSIRKLNNVISICTPSADRDNIKQKLIDIMGDVLFALEEINCTLDTTSNTYKIKKDILNTMIEINKNENNELDLKENITFMRDRLQNINFDSYNIYSFKQNVLSYILSMNDIIEESLSNVLSHIHYKKEFNYFNPNCINTDDITILKQYFNNVTTYASTKISSSLSAFKQEYDKVINGDLEGSRISNEVFDLIYSKIPVEYNAITIGNQLPYTLKKEKLYINSLFKYSKPDSIFILSLPYFRLYKDICSILSKNLSDIQVIKTDSFNSDCTILIIGKKKKEKEIDLEGFKYLRRLHNADKINNKDIELNDYIINNNFSNVEIFRGSILEQEELLNIIDSSNGYKDFFKEQKVEKLSETNKHPLLPFNIGQIGLVLTSGCLDGIVEETDKYNHLIKGRVIKSNTVSTTKNDNSIETEEVINNKVEISILLADGTLKRLS